MATEPGTERRPGDFDEGRTMTRAAASARLPLATALLAVLAMAGGAPHLHAQGVTTAGISGRITDPDGGPIAGVLIEVLHEGTGVAVRATSDDAGRFRVANLRPGGPYTLTASRIGLRAARREAISLSIGQLLVVDIALSAEAVEMPAISVRVESDPVFDRTRMGSVTKIDQPTLERLPTISRDFTEFAQLSPLVKVDEEGIAVAGSNLRFNNIQIDGALNQDVFGLSPTGVAGGQARGRVIPLSAIEELQVLIAPFDVRQSGFTGGVLNAVTRSGTNEWEGSAFAYYRDDWLVGDVVVGRESRDPGTLQDVLGGFDLGGPLIRDRLHVFAAGEFERRRSPPSGFQIGLDDPRLTLLSPDSVDRFREILAGYGADAGEAGSYTLENDLANVFARLDLAIDDRNSAMVRYGYALANDDPAPNRLPGDAYELSSNGTRVQSLSHSVVAQWLSTFDERISNDLLVNAQFLRDTERPNSLFPRVELEMFSDVGGGVVRGRLRAGSNYLAQASALDQDILQVTDAVTIALADHRLTLGAGLERFAIRRLYLPGFLGSYRFDSLAGLEANAPSQYDVSLNLDGPTRPVSFAVNQFSGFVQDELSIGEALNVRLGVRVDIPTMTDAPATNPDVAGTYGIETGRLPSGNPLFSPRIGFNLRLGERRTQIRGGAGLFTGRPPFAWLSNAYQNTGLSRGFLTCTNGNAPGFSLQASTTCTDGTGVGSAIPVVNGFDPDFRFPQDFKASLAVDQRLPGGVVASLEGVFTRAVKQVFLQDVNIGPAVDDEARTPENGYSFGFGFGSRESFGDGGIGYGTEPPFYPRRVSDAYSQVIRATNRSDNYAYAVSATVRKRWERRFALEAGYSYNRSADIQSLVALDATTNFGLTAIEGDPNAPHRQPSTFDRPHKVILDATARFERFGGTQLSLLYVGQSGRPYSYTYLGDINADGYPGAGQALDLSNDLIYVPAELFDFPGGGISGVLFRQLASQESCLAESALRILSRNACRLPWSHQVDVRLTQDLRLGAIDAQLVLDVLNVLNLLISDWGHVQTVNPTVQLIRVVGRREDDAGDFDPPEIEDPLQGLYMGPVEQTESGGFRAVRPWAPEIGPSQWQAQFGIRVSLR